MKWFAGNIATAIQVSKKNAALLIVFVESANEKGKEMKELWDKIEDSLFDCAFVGLHLKENDEAAAQFAAVYPTPVLPASYLIDNLGKPIDVITMLSELDYDKFYTKISKAVQTFKDGKAATSSSSSASASAGDVSSQQQDTPTSSLSMEEKIKRAKEMVERKRAAEEERKKAEDQAKELERIEMGKQMQKAQKEREDKELMEAAMKRRREKREDEKERERLKAQIKADREEREYKLRRNQTGGAGEEKKEETTEAKEIEKKNEPIASDRCVIMIRFPDGSSGVEDFPSDGQLVTLRDLVSADSRIHNGPFTLAQLYPRRVFVDEDLQRSFLELCLTPNATVIVNQKQKASASQIAAASPLGGIFSLIALLFAPLRFVWHTVLNFLGFGGGSASAGSGTTGGAARKNDAPTRGQGSSTAAAREQGGQQRGVPPGATIRRRGNVSGLHNTNGDDSDADNANWNGNSTQFF